MTILPPLEPADNSDGNSAYLSEVSPGDKSWDKHRANTDRVRGMYANVGYDRYAERMDNCSTWLSFSQQAGEEGSIDLKLKSAHFCRVRNCPVCQWRRSLMWRARFFTALPKIRENYPTYRFIFLTLTVRNCPVNKLRETVIQMNKGWKLLSNRKQFPAVGWLKSIEVTRNAKTLEAHPHIHAVLMVKSSYFSHGYLSKKAWAELWQSCLKVDYQPVLHIQAVKLSSKRIDAEEDPIMVALCETLKYSVKESDLLEDEQWLAEMTRQLHKTRAVSVGGVFKDYLSEEEPENLISEDADEETDSDILKQLHFGWREELKRYRQK